MNISTVMKRLFSFIEAELCIQVYALNQAIIGSDNI